MDARPLLLATLLVLGSAAFLPMAAADVSVSVPICDLEGHCRCVTPTVRTDLLDREVDRCPFVG